MIDSMGTFFFFLTFNQVILQNSFTEKEINHSERFSQFLRDLYC